MLSIVVVNWNGQAFLEGFLGSLARQSCQDFRLHFVDNGSTDDSLAIVKEYECRIGIDLLALDANLGFAEANNRGIDRALADPSDCIVTLNNDLELEADCLERLAEAMEARPEAGFFQILMINYYDRGLIDAAGIGFSRHWEARQTAYGAPLSGLGELAVDIAAPCAGAAAYRKTALLEVKERSGYFDSRFFAYYEDVDLGLRLKARGITGVLVKESRVYHVHSGTGGRDSAFKVYHLVRNRYLYLLKNLGAGEFRRARAFFLGKDLVNWAKMALRGKGGLAAAGMRGYRDYLRMAPEFDAGRQPKGS